MSDWKTRGQQTQTNSDWKTRGGYTAPNLVLSTDANFQNYKPIETPKPQNETNKYTTDEWKKLSFIDKIKAGLNAQKTGNFDYAPVQDLYKQEVDNRANSKLGAFDSGFMNSASLGSFKVGANKQTELANQMNVTNQPNVFTQSEQQHPWMYRGGEVAGYLVPGTAGSKAVKPLLKGVANPLLKRLAEGALVGGGMTAAQDTIEQKPIGQIVKDTAINTGLGAGLDLAIGLPSFIKGVNKNILDKAFIDKFGELPPLESKISNPSGIFKPLKVTTEPLKPQIDTNIPNAEIKPIEANLKPSIGATDRTKLGMDIVSSTENKVKQTPKEFVNNLYTRLIDVNHPIKNINENTYIKATNSKNVGGTVDYILKDGLVDRQGNKIGESLSSIVKDVPKNEENDFMNYVLQRHNIDRAAEGKPIDPSFTSEQSTKAVKLIEQKHPEYKVLNNRLVKFVNTFENEWGNKSGLISDNLWNDLQQTYKNYVPTQREFSTLEQGISKTNGKGFVNQGTPLSKATGSDRNIINPIENIMNLVNRTVRTARYNEVGQSLVEAISKNPQELSKYAEIIPKGEPINPNVKNIVSVLVNGEPVNVRVNDKPLLDALKSVNKTDIGAIESSVKKGTNLFKELITQKNPVFAIRNIARDIPTAYINGSENNPIKFTRDLIKAGKNLATNSEIAQKYKAVGGGGSNFFNSENTAKSAKELVNVNLPKKIINKIEAFNNITESAPRLAEFNRVLDKTRDVQKALYAASEVTTNFSRGGDISKHIDSFVPYLNAGIQGLDKLARQFINKPIPTVAKGLIGITTLTVALDQVNKDNPKYQELDNRTKDNYFLIPNGDTFIKIPKSRELGVLFASLFERSIRTVQGDKEAFKGFGNTVVTNFAPANPLENNIFSPALALKSNKDFANRDIVSRAMLEDNRSKYLQYDEKTSELTKKIAEEIHKTGIDLSPKQMDYLIKSYTGVIGQLGLPATTKSNGNTLQKITKPITTQFIADPLYSNQTLNDFYDNYDKIKTKAADRNILEKIPSKTLTKEERQKSVFTKASSDISDLNKKIRIAEANGDTEAVKNLRARILEVALKANNSIK